jgi:hypothetical protein
MIYAEHITQGNQMEGEKLAYIAGIVDGEGSIMIQRDMSISFMRQRLERGSTEPHYHACVRVGMNDPSAVNFIHEVTGYGKVVKEKPYHHKKPMYRWTIRRRDEIVPFLRLILPYLLVKKTQAELAIKFMDEWVSSNGIRLTDGIRKNRENAWLKMRELNGIVPPPATTKPRSTGGRDKSIPFESIV